MIASYCRLRSKEQQIIWLFLPWFLFHTHIQCLILTMQCQQHLSSSKWMTWTPKSPFNANWISIDSCVSPQHALRCTNQVHSIEPKYPFHYHLLQRKKDILPQKLVTSQLNELSACLWMGKKIQRPRLSSQQGCRGHSRSADLAILILITHSAVIHFLMCLEIKPKAYTALILHSNRCWNKLGNLQYWQNHNCAQISWQQLHILICQMLPAYSIPMEIDCSNRQLLELKTQWQVATCGMLNGPLKSWL